MPREEHRLGNAVLEAVRRLLGVPFCVIARVVGDSFLVDAEVGGAPGLSVGTAAPLADSLVGEVVGEQGVVSFTDRSAVLPRFERTLGIRAAVGFPITLRGGTVLGALLALDDRVQTFRPEDLALAADLACAAARDLEDALSFDREAELERARLAGLLARGMAHDFGNVLSSALANVRSLHRLLGPSGREPEAREALEELTASLEAGSELIARLRDVGRADARRSQRRGLDPTAVASKVVAMARGLFAEASGMIDLRLEHPDRSQEIRGDEHALEQALLNLVVNARDTLRDRGGRVTVRVISRTVEAPPPDLPFMSAGTWTALAVDDDGPGVDPAATAHLFEPGFTTKGGSGLGLFLVKTTATAHGGGVEVGRSKEGGARFAICLPATPRGSSMAFRPPLVLVADDERGLRRAIARELAAAGLAVAEAGSRAAALEIVDADPNRIVAAVIDRDLGDGSGADVAGRIRSKNPRALVIETSAASDGDGELLAKPFDLAALTTRVVRAVAAYAQAR